MDSQWSKQDACFATVIHVWLAINHFWRMNSMFEAYCTGKWAGSCQSNICHSWGYERLKNLKYSLKACFENVNITHMNKVMRGSREGTGDPEPLENHKAIWFIILIWIPWKITKLPRRHSMLGHHRPTSETTFKWRVAGGSMMAS